MSSIKHLRKDFGSSRLARPDLADDAMVQFEKWLHEAVEIYDHEATAMNLATVGGDGKPHSRIVLLKGIEKGELLFFTNYLSDKGHQLDENPHVAITFFWAQMERQVRIEGIARRCNDRESDAYFESRPFESRVGAWASPQSKVVDDDEVQTAFDALIQQYGNGVVPRPLHWGGYIIAPQMIEFWQGGAGRLHDRFVYHRQPDGWQINRLAP
jgi:pyridoxamine 5'-phosphate oxidase